MVYGYARSACRRGETDQRLLIDYYKTNIDYEKKPSLTSLISLHTYSKACNATLRQSEVEYTVNVVDKLF